MRWGRLRSTAGARSFGYGFDGDRLDKDSKRSFFGLLLNFEIGLSIDISVVFPAGLVKLNSNILIGFALDLSNKADDTLFLGDLLGVDDDLLSDFVPRIHSNID